jgi:hypothetical protein
MATTDDAARMESLLGTAVTKITDSLAASDLGTPGVGTGTWTTEIHRGVTVHTYVADALKGLGFTPSYAVSDGMAIVGSSLPEVRRVLDAHLDGRSVTASANYRGAGSGAVQPSRTVFYVNVEGIGKAIRDALPPEEQIQFDANVATNLRPVKSLLVTSSSTSDRQSTRVFLFIS